MACKTLAVLAFVTLIAPANAQSSGIITQGQIGDNSIWAGVGGPVIGLHPFVAEAHPLAVYTDRSYSEQIFVMDDGACLRGPLRIMSKGKEVFSLSAGADYPSGCSGPK